MNMSIENNMLHLLVKEIIKGPTYAFQIFYLGGGVGPFII